MTASSRSTRPSGCRAGRAIPNKPLPGVSFSTWRAPSPASPAYGGCIWRLDSPAIAPYLRARLPEDLVWLAEHLGQFVFVAPRRGLVVLRMGVTMGHTTEVSAARDQVLALIADLLEAR